MKILFLTVSTGGGHVKTAQALMLQMEKQFPGCKTMLINSLKYISPLIERLVTGTYLQTIKVVPGIYGKLYDFSEKDEVITDLFKGFNSILSGRLINLFDQYNPDAVVCTHSFPLQMLSFLKRRGMLKIPVVGVVTDYANHLFWKLEGVDAFIVAHESIKDEMVKMGIREDLIHAYGIPVTENFLSVNKKCTFLENMKLENKPTLLLMGGSLGFGRLQPIFSSLLEVRRDIQIIAVAGYNNKLRQQLEVLSKSSQKAVRILGYTDNISELMDSADLLITKPGGITVSEALIKKLPSLITTPIPGQEERNARFLVASGASFRISPYDDMEIVLRKTLDKPSALYQMSEAARKLAKPHASEKTVELVNKLILSPTYSSTISAAEPAALNG